MSAKSNFDSLADLVRCGICQNIFNNPWNLTCSHTFCKDCLMENIVDDEERHGIFCWTCNDFCHEEEFRENALMDKLAAKHRDAERKSKKCGLCDAEKPDWKCLDCDLVLCKSCQGKHSHQEGTEKATATVVKESSPSEPRVSCNLHNALMLDYFCKTCDQVVCPDCAEFDHSGHVIEEGDFAVERVQREIKDKLEMVDQRLVVVKDKVKILEEYEQKLSDHVNTVRKQVKTVRDLLVSVIENDYNDIQQKIDVKSEAEMQKAFALKADLIFQLNNDTKATTDVQDCLKAHEGIDLLHHLTSSMKSKLDAAVNRDQGASLAALHCLNISFQKFDQMPDANLVGGVDFEKSPIELPNLPPPVKQPSSKSKKPSANLKQFVSVPQETSVIQLKSFSPRLGIYADRIWLPCPTENKVLMYKKNGKLEKTFTCEEIKRPMSVVRLSAGDILIACDSNHGLVQLDAMGKFKRRVREGSFSQISVVDSVIYGLEYKLCRVLSYTFHGGRSWNEKNSWGLRYQNGNNCDSIYACGDSIYVSSWWNKCIYHYNGKGSLLAQYGRGVVSLKSARMRSNSVPEMTLSHPPSTPTGSGLKRPRVSSADDNGCVLISDTDSHCIYLMEAGSWHALPIQNCRSPYDIAVDEKNKCLWLLAEYGLRLQQLSY